MVKSIPEDVRIGALNEIKGKIEAAVDRVKVLCRVIVSFVYSSFSLRWVGMYMHS